MRERWKFGISRKLSFSEMDEPNYLPKQFLKKFGTFFSLVSPDILANRRPLFPDKAPSLSKDKGAKQVEIDLISLEHHDCS